MKAYYKSPNHDFNLLRGDTFELLPQFNFKFDMIFADPPYFLSSGGISVQSGKIVCVDKGDWDKSMSQDDINAFNLKWLSLCREKLNDNGTIWISGTYHNIFSVANCLTQLGYKILNVITWAKTNPPPNISCRYFTYSTEFIIWARKSAKVPHYYNYDLMKHINGDTQMTDVWRMPAIAQWEKSCGKHPTQKPLGLLSRIIMASTEPGAWILDPFAGSSTTGIAANLLKRRFLGIERETEFADISKARREEIERVDNYVGFRRKIPDIVKAEDTQTDIFGCFEPNILDDLPFLTDSADSSKQSISGLPTL
ncbi:MAG: site-specific DNA-methyltransferase [Bacteroidaceae bacterium]|nr:site-specific DNA-methyltransferase [Bacteroidaceae bacterium]